MIYIKSPADIAKMQEAGRIHVKVMEALLQECRAGVSTLQLDELATKAIASCHATPSFLGYRGFPASICASLNDEIVHGIPAADRVLRNGDLLKLDLGVNYQGFHADAGRTVAIGQCSAKIQRLIAVTRQAFFEGIKAVKIGNTVNQIGLGIERYVKAQGYEVVRELVGHGVGQHLHEDPEIPNYFRANLLDQLQAGMSLAIEPMVNIGTWRIRTLADGWTVVTADGSLSAYYEDTVILTANSLLNTTIGQDYLLP